MPYVTNPTGFSVFCHALSRSLGPGEIVMVSDGEAERVSQIVFTISANDPTAERPTTRKTVTRGTKTVETTEATPAAEVR